MKYLSSKLIFPAFIAISLFAFAGLASAQDFGILPGESGKCPSANTISCLDPNQHAYGNPTTCRPIIMDVQADCTELFGAHDRGYSFSCSGGCRRNGTSLPACDKGYMFDTNEDGTETCTPIAPILWRGLDTSNNFYQMWDSVSEAWGNIVYQNGRVGIGTTTPLSSLEVSGAGFPNSFVNITSTTAADAGLRINSGGGVRWHIFNQGSDHTFRISPQSYYGGGIRILQSGVFQALNGASIGTTATPPLRGLLVDGNTGIGTTSPVQKLDVRGSAYVSERVGINVPYPQTRLDVNSSENQDPLLVMVNGWSRLRVRSNGGTTIGTASIDEAASANGLRVLGRTMIGHGSGPFAKLHVRSDQRTNAPVESNGMLIEFHRNTGTFTAFRSYNNLGASIGTESLPPDNGLRVGGNAIVDGNIGAGTVSPIAKVHIIAPITQIPLRVTQGDTTTLQVHTNMSTSIGHHYQGPNRGLYVWGWTGLGTSEPVQRLDVRGNTYVSQRIGIGIESPESTLHINGNISNRTPMIITSGTSASYSLFRINSNGSVAIGNTPAHQTSAMGSGQLWVTGNVGLGTHAPIQKLDVRGSAYVSNRVGIGTFNPQSTLDVVGTGYFRDSVTIHNVNYDYAGLMVSGTSQSQQRFPITYTAPLGNQATVYLNASIYGSISGPPEARTGIAASTANSNGTNRQMWGMWTDSNIRSSGHTTASDERLKENIVNFDNGLEAIKKFRPVSFDWISDGKADVGLIAQEVERIAPDIVDNSGGDILGVKYDKIPLYLINAIKEMDEIYTARFKSLEDENAELKAKVEDLEERLSRLEALMN